MSGSCGKYKAERMALNQSYSPLIAPLLSSLVAKIKSRTSFRQIISGVVFNAQKESGQTHACILPIIQTPQLRLNGIPPAYRPAQEKRVCLTFGGSRHIPAGILCQFIIQNLSSGKDITNLKTGFSIDKLRLLC